MVRFNGFVRQLDGLLRQVFQSLPLVIMLVGLIVSAVIFYEVHEKSFGAKKLKMIEERTGLRFPDGTRGLNMVVDEDRAMCFAAKILIPELAYEPFARQIMEMKAKAGYMDLTITNNLSWWHPSVDTRKLYGDTTDGLEIYLCREDGQWVLYVLYVSV